MTDSFSQFPSYPKNLSYNIKKLDGSIIKQRLKIYADLTEYTANQTVRFNLPIGRSFDERSLVVYATGTCSGSTAKLHFPRGGLHSLIENFQITANGRTLQNTPNYNFVWNTLADMEGYSSIEQQSKRITELADPSVYYTSTYAGEGVISSVNNNDAGTAHDTDIQFCANNFLGFFNGSCSVINTNDLGQIVISLGLAPASCLFYSADTDAAISTTGATYKLKDVYLTLDSIIFENSTYNELVKNQLMSDGLNIGYYDYIVQMGTTLPKSSTINFSTQINASSLDQVIATFRRDDYDTIRPLILWKSTLTDAAEGVASTGDISFNKYCSDPWRYVDGGGATNLNVNLGDGFNQSAYFQRAGAGIKNSSWYINSQPFTNQSVPIEIFNGTLQTLGYNNLDIASGGIHFGCQSIHHFNKYYFTDALSLENISGDSTFWVSGLNGNGGTILINYQANFDSTATKSVKPVIIARVCKRLNIKIGRSLDLIE